jgi:hypothetical protein
MERMNLTAGERDELMALRLSHSSAALVRRARLILMLGEGQSWSVIKSELGCDSLFISTWGGRFVQARLGGLFARHPGRAPRAIRPSSKRAYSRALSTTNVRRATASNTKGTAP